MKFGEELRKNMIPEWMEKYVQYDEIARLIEKQSTALAQLESDGLELGEWVLKLDENNEVYLEGALKSAKAAFDLLIANVHEINKFVCFQGKAFAKKTDELFEALEVSQATAPRLVSERELAGTIDAEMSLAGSVSALSKFNFKQGSRVAEEMIKSVPRVMEVVLVQRGTPQPVRKPQKSQTMKLLSFSKSKKSPRGSPDMKQLWKVYVETYRGWTYLEDFVKLNRDAFVKILKKFDKHFHQQLTAQLLPLIDAEYCFSTQRFKQIIHIMEELWVSWRKDLGSRARAMDKLRLVKDRKKRFSSVHDTFWVGLVSGMAIMLGAVALSEASSWDHVLDYEYGPMIAVLRCFGLGTVMMFLWGVNGYVWSKCQINFHFIFELPFAVNVVHIFQAAAFNALAWLLVVYIMLRLSTTDLLWSGLLAIFMAAVYLNPFNVWSFPLRKWFLHLLVRSFVVGWKRVRFCDFWMMDQLVSMSILLSDFQFMCCYLIVDSFRETSSCLSEYKSWSRGLLFAVPYAIRFLQCIRKYLDDGKPPRHLYNALKYTIGILITITSSLATRDNSTDSPWRAAWIALAIMGYMYSSFWDIRMDWGFFTTSFSDEHWPLRTGLTIFPSRKIYYLVIFTNLLLRMSWVWSITNDYNWVQHPVLWKTITASLELLRRFQWNLVRVEYENSHNVEKYRAVREIPVPEVTGMRELQPIAQPVARIQETVRRRSHDDLTLS